MLQLHVQHSNKFCILHYMYSCIKYQCIMYHVSLSLSPVTITIVDHNHNHNNNNAALRNCNCNCNNDLDKNQVTRFAIMNLTVNS